MEHIHEGSQCGGYRCANCGQSSPDPFDCPCGAGRADHVLIIEDAAAAEPASVVRMPNGVMDYLQRGTTPVEAAEAELRAAVGNPETYERALARQAERRSQPPAVRHTGRPIMAMLAEALGLEGRELGPCHLCGGEADGECVICDRPVCGEDAAHQDHGRFCRECAPSPATATEG